MAGVSMAIPLDYTLANRGRTARPLAEKDGYLPSSLPIRSAQAFR
jgi:hypothetical protein